MDTNSFFKYMNILGLFQAKNLDIFYTLRFQDYDTIVQTTGLSND